MKSIFTLSLLMAAIFISAQTPNSNWKATFTHQQVFIENKGQWNNLNNLPGSEVLFATDYAHFQTIFTKSGLTYRLSETKSADKKGKEDSENEMKEKLLRAKSMSHAEREAEENRTSTQIDYVQMQWENSNPDVEVVAQNPVSHYYNYSVKGKGIDHVKAFGKIIYKNLYPNIDVEYVFHPDNGIEYSFILHPGADASVIKMKYSDVSKITFDAKRNLHYATVFGDIIEHAPLTAYSNSGNSSISSQFIRDGKTISFALGNYNKSETVIIDPWVQSPNFATQWDCVWECEKDAAGNAYIMGGVQPEQLLKYSAAGVLQWTYTTPYDTANFWLGTIATDAPGNTYVTGGSIAAIQKVSTAGALVWDNPNPGGIFSTSEFWSISFNCDQTKLIVGGTGGGIFTLGSYIYQVDMNSGNVTSSLHVTGTSSFPDPDEIRSITACGNGKYYFLTHDSIGYINQNFGVCSNTANAMFYTNNGYQFAYGCDNFRSTNSGMEAIKTYGGYVYVNRGSRLDKRNFTTGAIIASVAIPGGAFTTQFGRSYVENSGIDIDASGNIYVGSKNQVVKYDQSLTQLATYPTSSNYNVYDVEISTNGNIIVCGSTGNYNSGARTGSVEQIAAGAGGIVAITCCDASVCQSGPFCTTDGPVTLTPSTPGGIWTGVGITNQSTGVFSPATAGQGTHYITNTISCGSDSIAITVNICASLAACRESNGSITVSNGTGPYTWYKRDSSQNCSTCIFGCILPPGCAVTTYTWTLFSTGPNATPTQYPVKILDVNNNELILNDGNNLTPCSTSCSLTASATPNNTTCGNNNGGATVTAAGGTPTAYAWSNGGTNASISSVAAGTYTVTVTAGACSATASAVVSSSSGITASASSTTAGCTSTGTATATISGGTATGYAWSNSGTTATISNLAAGAYTVTVTSSAGCTATATTTVGSTGGITLSSSVNNATCGNSNGSATVTVTSGTATGYNWSSGATAASASNLAAGTYTVTVTGPGGCSATASAVVGSNGAPTVTTSSTGAACNSSNGSATVTVTSGTATGYSWSSGATTATASNLAAGTYTVTVTGTGGCTVTASATVSASTGVVISASSTNTSCGNNNGSATVSVTQGTATGYAWSTGATSSSLSNLAAGTYTVTVNDGGGCSATASVTVGGSGANNVTITSDKSIMCATDSAQICAPTGYTTYQWNTGATTPCIYTKLAGNYYVTVTDAGNCTATSNHLAINVHAQPPVSISVNGDTLLAYNSVTYQWYLNGVAIQGANTPLWIATQTGSYTVLISDANGCTALSLPVVIAVTGIDALTKETISVYPNPNNDGNFNLSVSSGWIGAVCEVFDAEGRLIYQSEIRNQKSEIGLTVATGVYMLRITEGTKTITQKLVKL